ncbi:MAG TPA: XRE family transcriptional regulator [Candidatus Micrarchaeaceae archaeon]|nr:XRE family transcriptional regulator [Candidatus Micrarchaeaceae archaeon]
MATAAEVGARIRDLRERTEMQSQQLAAKVGIDPSAMSNIERGKRSVKTDELASIADALGVSPLAILSPDSLLARMPVAARVQVAQLSDGSAVKRLTALAELNEVLSEGGMPPTHKLTHVPPADTVRWLETAIELADWARQRLELDAPSPDRFSNLAEAIENRLGIDVMVESYSREDFAGASITDWTFPFILVNQDQPTTRALFTLAHELGHVLSKGGAILTLDVNLTALTNWERFANAFAANFLMPEAHVNAIVKKQGREVGSLATMLVEFGVSFESLVYRLHNLALINAAGRDQLKARGWTGVLNELDDTSRRKALLDSMGSLPEHRAPGLLSDRVFHGYQQGVVSVRPLAGLLHVDADGLLDRLVRNQDSMEVLNTRFLGDQASELERYSGNPV